MATKDRQLALFDPAALPCRDHPGQDQTGQDPSIRRAGASILPQPPSDEDLSWMHSGLCQTALPHVAPKSNTQVWERRSSRCALIVEPGTVRDADTGQHVYVGVPYGPRARLIMIYLQTMGVHDRMVPLGRSMSAWIRSLGIAVTGGQRGTIAAVKEQILRIASCSLKLEWTDADADGGEITTLERTQIVRGLRLWAERPGREKWPTHVELSHEFHAHLREHAVPLDKRAIAMLSGNSMALDLYTLLAYRLPRLSEPAYVPWTQLMGQFGSDCQTVRNFALKIRRVLPDVLSVYDGARVEEGKHGLVLQPGPAAVRRQAVSYAGLYPLAINFAGAAEK